ncbi:hypothetical protein FRB90_009498 [Tulasnella sp. 427]|nr:hypothetical protein FRB90_009498 [Tulasnella sp. 427]
MWAASKSGVLSTAYSALKFALDDQDAKSLELSESLTSSRGKQQLIDSNIDAMRAVIDTLRSQIIQASSQRNSLSAINQLPLEIIIEIFHYVLESRQLLSEVVLYYQTLQYLASVSTAWRDIVCATPSFWRRVEFVDDCQAYPLASSLKHSQEGPLDISCYVYDLSSTSYLDPSEKHRLDAMRDDFHRALSQLPRWRSLGIITGCGDTARDLIVAPATTVQRLQVELDWDPDSDEDSGWSVRPITLFNGHTSGLQELRIEGMPFSWEDSNLEGLRILDLRDILNPIDFPWVNISNILTTLRACPELQELSLVEVFLPDGSDNFAVPEGGITLSKLKSLTLEHIGSSSAAVQSILRSIRAPALSQFSVVHLVSDSPILSIPNLLTPHIPSLQQTILLATEFEISFSTQNVRLIAGPGDCPTFQMDLRLPSDELPELMHWLIRYIPLPSSPKRMDISLMTAWAPESDIFLWVRSATCLTIGPASGADSILRRLSKAPKRDDDFWLWPDLQELCITDSKINTGHVSSFLQARYGSVGGGQQMQGSSGPPRLALQAADQRKQEPKKLARIHIEVINIKHKKTLKHIREMMWATSRATILSATYAALETALESQNVEAFEEQKSNTLRSEHSQQRCPRLFTLSRDSFLAMQRKIDVGIEAILRSIDTLRAQIVEAKTQ